MEEARKNPFTPTFGSIPPQLAGRDDIIRDILDGLKNGPGDPNRASLFTGARGSGKTVLLAKIAEEAESDGWISVNVNADTGLLDELLVQARDKARELLAPESTSYITSVSLGGVAVSRAMKENPEKSTWRSDMTGLLKELNAKKVGLLITLDELNVSIDEVRTLVVTFQHFVRERREVALIMAGLPQKVSSVLRDDSLSFLRRAFMHHLGPVEENEVRYSLKKTVGLAGRKIENDALSLATESTKGFPFMIQLIGYHMWRQQPEAEYVTHEDAVEAVHLAEADLEKMIFDTTFRELSEKDIAFLLAMLKDGEYSFLSDIAERMQVTSKYAGMYRKRLIEQGIIGSHGHGKVAFELPMFRDYLENRTSAAAK